MLFAWFQFIYSSFGKTFILINLPNANFVYKHSADNTVMLKVMLNERGNN